MPGFPRLTTLLLLFNVPLVACGLFSHLPTAVALPLPQKTQSILSPAPGLTLAVVNPTNSAVLPSNQPLEVRYSSSGGALIEAGLTVDGNSVDFRAISSNGGLYSDALLWKQPIPGVHSLRVQVMDDMKRTAEVTVKVSVEGAQVDQNTNPQNPPEAKSSGIEIRFIGLEDNSTLDPGLDKTGLPIVHVEVEASGPEVRDVVLDAGGIQVARLHNDSGSDPFRAWLDWSPWRGGGEYRLTVYARTADAAENKFRNAAAHSLTVLVGPFPPGSLSVQQRMVSQFQNRFHINVPVPTVGRYIRPSPGAIDPSRWVSVVYLRDTMYELELSDEGQFSDLVAPLNSNAGNSECRPAGRYRILVAVVDYGNTGIARDQALTYISRAAAEANTWHSIYALNRGLNAPLVQLDVTPVFVGQPPVPGEMLTDAQVFSATGVDPTRFDLLAELDLDAASTVSLRIHGLGMALYGGCSPAGANRVNLFFTATDANALETSMPGSLFDHELAHDMGWMHWWVTGDGGALSQNVWNSDNRNMPSLLFGWQDSDGDGIVEILDPNPYGIP